MRVGDDEDVDDVVASASGTIMMMVSRWLRCSSVVARPLMIIKDCRESGDVIHATQGKFFWAA